MTVRVGDTFMADYNDGRFQWTVDEVIDGRVVLASSAQVAEEWGRTQPKAFTAEDVEASMALEREWRRVEDRNRDFWNAAVPGDVLHYHDGFGQYVRGIVVERDGTKQLLPLELVGSWDDHSWEFHWAGIKRKRSLQPNQSCVYESPTFVPPHPSRDPGVPRDLEPLDFTDREADADYFQHCMGLEDPTH